MILKNYTTDKSYLRTIPEIEQLLISIGAQKILKDYDTQGNCTAISFIISFDGRNIPIKLPARIDRIPLALRRLYNEDKSLTSNQRTLLKKAMSDNNRARNIGWRIIQDWLEAQIAVKTLDQINMLEALLPFTVMREGKTMYELLEENNFDIKQLSQHILTYQPKEEKQLDNN